MIDIYDLILREEQLKKIEAHRNTIKKICQQTTECALFVSEYASHMFGTIITRKQYKYLIFIFIVGRIIRSNISDQSGKVKAYQHTFTDLRDKFLGQSTIATEIAVFQMSAKMDGMLSVLNDICKRQIYPFSSALNNILEAANQELDRLPRASSQRKHDGCHTGTRQDIIQEILTWFSQPVDDDAKRLFWLHGVAGCGKSAIAQSVSEQLLTQRRCASFFFNASVQTKAGLDCLYTTLSRDLARLSNGWKAALVRSIKNLEKDPDELALTQQLERFVLQPAEHVDVVGPILIIIDAIDESGSYEQRKPLLSTLSRLGELPTQFRFFVTSRSENDIRDAFGKLNWITVSDLDSTSSLYTDHDILTFVRNRLQDIPALKTKSIDDLANQITSRSDRLFQWAFTACKYIEGDGGVGHDYADQLQDILFSNSFKGLDGLYHSILSRLCNFEQGSKRERRFQVIMGRVLSLQEPLSLAALSTLRSEEEDTGHVESILSPLGSLLRGISSQDEPVQPLHESFPNFLKDPTRSGRYWIDTNQQAAMISTAALREMKKLLKFNICGLGTSYVFNRNISDLDSRVQHCIPPHLSYACCFWIDHLCSMTPTDEWCSHLNTFMQHYFFFWLEAMSLLSRVERISTQLSMLKDWLESMVSDPDSPLTIVIVRITYIGLHIRMAVRS
jgi:hypothetical protein